jgi:hypothetical protein
MEKTEDVYSVIPRGYLFCYFYNSLVIYHYQGSSMLSRMEAGPHLPSSAQQVALKFAYSAVVGDAEMTFLSQLLGLLDLC